MLLYFIQYITLSFYCKQGRSQDFFGGSAPVGVLEPPEIHKFHWSREGLSPNTSHPEYAFDCWANL